VREGGRFIKRSLELSGAPVVDQLADTLPVLALVDRRARGRRLERDTVLVANNRAARATQTAVFASRTRGDD